MTARSGLLLTVLAVGLAGCGEPEINRPGTWKPTGVNDQNLRAMLVNPQDAYVGTGALTARGDGGARAVTRLLTDRRRALLDTSLSRIAPSSSGADAAPLPSGNAQ